MPMARNPDRMDLDVVGDDGQETAWWEHLTKDGVRMREFVEKLNPACLPIDAGKACPEVDNTLEKVYYGLHPSLPPGISIPSFATARAQTISTIIGILRQSHPNTSVSKGDMGAFSISSFLNESYPKSAPFSVEALHSRAGDGVGDGNSVASSHGSSGGPRSSGSLSIRERPSTSDRFHPRDSQPHRHPHHGKPSTHTLSDATGYSQGRSNSDSPGASGSALSDGCPSADESTISSFSSTINTPSRSRTPSHSRSVLNRGPPYVRTGNHFDVPRSRALNGTGPGGQHKCDECEKAFPYPSKLKDHMHIHQQDKPLPCDHLGCLKKFKRARELQAHKKTHDRRATLISRPSQVQFPARSPGQSPVPLPPPQHPFSPLGRGECSTKSKPPDSDRTSSTSPGDEYTFSGSPSPASSHIGGRVATPERPVIDIQGREVIDLKEPDQPTLPASVRKKLDIQLFPNLPGIQS
ncbi:unnamed protein product [Tuber melanosporum]|uniref:C2H2 type master regulator of conidiophore development brlA n=1 Tax=Tuber melanosporum (strain Mel28) TaxID=656061 RepID=D5GM78_TUBMM|nr:uncharacterized protein GSTUM_00010559001 [Tuber melanosporum]CAZ85621.1 unnamed protein product [Tuber melanosporum]